MLFTLSLFLCACGEVKSGVYYNGKELDEKEIEALMYHEPETERVPTYNLIAFDDSAVAPTSDSVFWTKSGSVFHQDALCRHLSSVKDVYYGTAKDAVSAGKERVCTACANENQTEDE
ncbi:MAG: hypothetical protein J6B12_02430 [Clostridia bacterium]|nr:hypothetical protein [Clostridia bacterium]